MIKALCREIATMKTPIRNEYNEISYIDTAINVYWKTEIKDMYDKNGEQIVSEGYFLTQHEGFSGIEEITYQGRNHIIIKIETLKDFSNKHNRIWVR